MPEPTSPSCSDILVTYATATWKNRGNTGDPLIPPPDDLRQWLTNFGDVPPNPYRHESLEALSSIDLPQDWQSKAWHHFQRMDIAINKIIALTEIPEPLYTPGTNLPVTARPTIAMIAIFSGWNNEDNLTMFRRDFGISTLEAGVEALFHLWNRLNTIRPDEFPFPVAPIIEAWQQDQTPTVHLDTRRPRRIADDSLKGTRSAAETNEQPTLPLLTGVTSAHERWLPGFEVEASRIVPVVPLDAPSNFDDKPSRGASPIDRILIFAQLAVHINDRANPLGARIPTTLRNIIDWRFPNGWQRGRDLPKLRADLYAVHNKRYYWEGGRWNPVSVPNMPEQWTTLDHPVPLDVHFRPGTIGQGALINVDRLTHYSIESPLQFRAWYRLAYCWDEAKRRNGGFRIYATRNKVLRNDDGFLLNERHEIILSSPPYLGKDGNWHAKPGDEPQKKWYHPWAVVIGEEPNPQAAKAPVYHKKDILHLCYDDSPVPPATSRSRASKSAAALDDMETQGDIVILRDQLDEQTGRLGIRILEPRS